MLPSLDDVIDELEIGKVEHNDQVTVALRELKEAGYDDYDRLVEIVGDTKYGPLPVSKILSRLVDRNIDVNAIYRWRRGNRAAS